MPLRTALRIAFRELRATPAKFIFVAFAVAVGVAALSGVKSFGSAFRGTLLHNAKQLIAADVQGQIWNFPTPEELARVEQLSKQAGAFTRVTETVSMAGSAHQRIPQLVSVKAVDPSVYPFYGKLTLRPAKPLRELLADNSSAVATPELLVRLKVHVGDSIRIGGQSFRLTGVIAMEPDRLASGFGPGMRVIISREGLQKTGLVQFGSRAAQRFLFKLSPDTDVDAFEAQLKSALGRVFVSDYRRGSPMVGQAIETTTTFLSLITLIALIVGALGVGMAIHSHIQQRLDTIGIIKAIGGRSTQVMAIYLTQTVVIGVAGGLMGIAAGFAVQRLFPVLMHQIFAELPAVQADWSFAAQGIAAGLLTTILFTLPALLSVRSIRPNVVFRREMAESLPRRRRSLAAIRQGFLLVVMLACFVCLAAWVANSWRTGLYFTFGLLSGVAVLAAAAALLVLLLRSLAQKLGIGIPTWLRHGLANVYRPGSHVRSILVALGIGVMFVLTTYLLQRSVLHEVMSEGPGQEGNLFLLDIRDSSAITKLVESQPGVTSPLQLVGYIVARMVSKNGRDVGQLHLSRQLKERAEAVRLTTATTLPSSLHLTQGQWWPGGSHDPQLAVSTEAQRNYHLRLGNRIRFQVAGRIVEAPVVAVFDRDARAPVRYDLVFPRDALAGLPVVYYGTVHADPQRIPDIEAAIFEHYPNVTVMNLADILKRVQDAVDQIALVIRFLASFAVAAGLIIMASTVVGTKYRRIREIAILKALGGTRQHIRAGLLLEFSVVGAVAGIIGGALGNLFMKLLTQRLIEVHFDFDFVSIAFAMVATAVVTNMAGWMASSRMLRQSPLAVLREE